MRRDHRTKRTVSHNFVNLPTSVASDNGDMISYTYTATGINLSQALRAGKGGTSTRRDYAGPFVFVNNAPAWVSTPHGRFVQVNGSWENEFHLRDHLGNTRVVLMEEDTGTLATLQQNHYYPFGMLNPSLSTANTLGALKDNRYLYNGKELQDDFGLDWYDYGARFYDGQIGRWHVVDPLAEQAPDRSPYRYGFNNPIRYTDPTGMWEDDFVFNEKGNFVRIDKNDQPDKLVIENSKTGARQNYWFADPEEDTQQIRDGIINKVVFVSKSQIEGMLSKQGAFNPDNKDNWIHFYSESKGGHDFDYSYSVIPAEFASQGASFNPLFTPSPMLFIPEGDYMAHNHMNFGNYLWAASGYTLGFSYATLQIAAHANSFLNSRSNGYPPQLDSKDDQRSILKGAYYAQKNGFRQILQKAVEAQKSQNKR